MLHAFYEHFVYNFPVLVAYFDMNGPETMAAFLGSIPQADNAFNRFFNKEK
jgi:hypothetical protein